MDKDSTLLGRFAPVTAASASQSSGSVASRFLGYVILGLGLGSYVTRTVTSGVNGFRYGPLTDALVISSLDNALRMVQGAAVGSFRAGANAQEPLGPLTIMAVDELSTAIASREYLPSGTIYKVPEGATIAGYVINTDLGYLKQSYGHFSPAKVRDEATLFDTMNALLVALQKNAKNNVLFFGTATVEIVVESYVVTTRLQERALA